MKYFCNLFLCCFILSIIKATIAPDDHSIHYKSQHFTFYNPSQFTPIHIHNPNDEIISCTLAMPSLCIYTIPSMPGFHIFYDDIMFDFLQDTNWSSVTVTNNLDNEAYHNIVLQLSELNTISNNINATTTQTVATQPQQQPSPQISSRRRLRGSYTWRGCYKDRSRRALRRGPHKWGYSIDKCSRACSKYRYFSLQAGSWCSCENSWAHATKYGRARGCPRSHKGAGWRNDVFQNRRRRKRRRRGKRGKRGRCNMRCRLRRALNRVRGRLTRRSKEKRMRSRVYKRLYRFGKLLGRSMKKGNFGGLCGLTGECDMGGRRPRPRPRPRRRSRCNGCGCPQRARCPTRFATYLGPPHVVGGVSYIMGTPPVGTAPRGWANSQRFPMGLGVSPMYGGMMGGMHGMQAPGLYPGHTTGWSANPQAMMGDMGYGKKEDKKDESEETKVKVKVKKKRRLLIDESDYNIYNDIDIRLKKCVFVTGNQEICATYYYMYGVVELEYNEKVNNKNNNEKHKMIQYIKSNVWIWTENDNEKEDISCNKELLDFIGYIICIQQNRNDNGNEMYAFIVDDMNDDIVKKLDLMNSDWEKMYEINEAEHTKKICQYIEMIELCFEMTSDHQKIEITTQRILPNED